MKTLFARPLFLSVALAALLSAAPIIAEEIRLTTYYPAPFGEYNELTTNDLIVDGPITATHTDNAEAFYFTQTNAPLTGQKDVFTIEDQDPGGGGQDKSSVLKVHKSGAINAGDLGFSLIEMLNSGIDPGDNKYWLSGSKVDESTRLWGVDITDNDYWSTGGMVLGVTGAADGTYSGGNFIVEQDGDVGIGTTTPGANLEVSAGTLGTSLNDELLYGLYRGATGNNDQLRLRLLRTTAGGGWTNASHVIQRRVDVTDMGYIRFGNFGSDLLTFGENTTEYMRIDGTGNVGIGTTAPAAPLHVRVGTAGTEDPVLTISANDNRSLSILQPDNAVSSDPWTFATGNAYTFRVGATDALTVASDGRVGIGTVGPGRILDVTERMRVRNGAGTAGIWYADGGTERQFAGVRVHSATGTAQQWGVFNNGAWQFIVRGNGRVGIGTVSPAAKLNIFGAAGVDDIRLTDNAPQIKFQDTDAGAWRYWIHNNGNRLYFLTDGGLGGGWTAARPLTIFQNSVGIGTATPTHTLSVNGTASKPGGGSWSFFSDPRLKTIHGSFKAGLQEVLQLNPIRYNYKEDNVLNLPSQKEHIGLNAKEVEKIIPEAISKTQEGHLIMNNDPIFWAMLNAIQEQQKTLESQQKEIAELRAMIQKL